MTDNTKLDLYGNHMDNDLPFDSWDGLIEWFKSKENQSVLGDLSNQELNRLALAFVYLAPVAPYPAEIDFNLFSMQTTSDPKDEKENEKFTFIAYQKLIQIGAVNLMRPSYAETDQQRTIRRWKELDEGKPHIYFKDTEYYGELLVDLKKCNISISPLVKVKLVKIIEEIPDDL